MTSEEKRNMSVPPPVDESATGPGDENCGEEPGCDKMEFHELQVTDPGNQGA